MVRKIRYVSDVNLIKRSKALFNPERFQGWGRRRRYFEGWYFKMIGPNKDLALALIPGVAFDKKGKGHAFIQVLDGLKGTSVYHRFPVSEFSAVADRLEVRISDNRFGTDGIDINLPELKGSVAFGDQIPWPKPWYSPGIMGPYAFAPFMECYHGIVSMDHSLSGYFHLDDRKYDLQGGRGYIEKDWGRSFPSAYVWMQSNHFETEGVSIKASVARIPWLTGDFNGFIAGIWTGGELYRFTTYNGSRLMGLDVSKQRVSLRLASPKYDLKIFGLRDHATELASPILGAMSGKVEETMRAQLHVELVERRSSRTVFKGVGGHAGLEVAGDIDLIVTSHS